MLIFNRYHQQQVSFQRINVIVTFFSSFSISSLNCVLNFEPTEMKFNFPFDVLLFLAVNKTFMRGFADS